MRAPVPALPISDGQREVLEAVSRSQASTHSEVVRGKELLMAADGMANTTVAQSLSVPPSSVSSWRERFVADGLGKSCARVAAVSWRFCRRRSIGSST